MMRRPFLTLLVVVACATALAGCGAKNQSTELKANPWVVTSVRTADGHQSVLSGTTPAISFRADGTAVGNSTVNVFRGPYTVEARTIRIGPLAASKWASSTMESAQDELVRNAFASASRYVIRDGALQLSDSSQNVLMDLKVAQEPTLVGPTWACTSYEGPGGLASISGTTPVVAAFAPDGTLTGFGGVNQYTGPYTVSGSKMTIGPDLASTKMAGPAPQMTQETDYFAAIKRTESFKIEGYQLTLLDASGAVLAVYAPLAPKN